MAERVDTHRLYEGERHPEAEAWELDERTRVLIHALRHQHVSDLDRLINAIGEKESATEFETDNFYMAVGDAALVRGVPTLPTPGQWVFDGFVAWADPAAQANVAVQLWIAEAWPIPFGFVASKTDVYSRGDLRLPVNQQSRVKLSITGTAGDRCGVIVRYARYL